MIDDRIMVSRHADKILFFKKERSSSDVSIEDAKIREKMKQEMEKSAQIDEAFKAIKTETGVTDVDQMVKKFLTREETYSQLLVNVKESDTKIEKLKKDNEHLRSVLHELKIDSEAAEDDGAKIDQLSDDEIKEMRETIAQ